MEHNTIIPPISADPVAVCYQVTLHHPGAHLFEVTCTVNAPDFDGQVFSLPAWIPGSYMIREFARHIVEIKAFCGDQPVALNKLDKHRWKTASLPAAASELILVYRVYAWDLSVRAACLDTERGFFNGTSLLLAIEGKTEQPCQLLLPVPQQSACDGWTVATAMSAVAVDLHGFGRYQAQDYAELIDHPVLMGKLDRAVFDVDGVPHQIVFSGAHDADMARLSADVQQICRWQIALFGTPAPMPHYLFLVLLVGEGYGGLEHRASTALISSRKDLPYVGMKDINADYQGFLGLCSHEYFHSWNIKRIKPAAFMPYELSRENYTRLLWVFEGFTSYYDDLALVRSGVVSVADYLKAISKTINQVLSGTGRFKQSVAESSFDAWTKYYRQDENASNAIVSYYTKGSLIALLLDLQLRFNSDGRLSLDNVMQHLWQRYGQQEQGLEERSVFELLHELTADMENGAAIVTWLEDAVYGTEDLALSQWLERFAVRSDSTAPAARVDLGVRLKERPGGVEIAATFEGGGAQNAGLSAGDQVVACNGIRIANSAAWHNMLLRYQPGDRIDVVVFRQDELKFFTPVLQATSTAELTLTAMPPSEADAAALVRRQQWLA